MVYFVLAMIILIPCTVILYKYYTQRPSELRKSKTLSQQLKEMNVELKRQNERNQLAIQRIRFLEEKIITRELADNFNLPWPTVNDVDRKRILEILEKEYNASQE